MVKVKLAKVCFIFMVIIQISFGNVFRNTLKMKEKIISGDQENIFNVPYQVSVQYRNSHICGGSIISNQHILTAAHCVNLRPISNLSINLGSSFYYLPQKNIRIHKFKIHDLYNSTTYDNDLAILLLISKITFGPNILPVALPVQNEHLPLGSLGTVSGWGQTQESIKLLSNKLRTIQIPTISNERCAILNAPNLVTKNMICAKDSTGGRKDTCQGDSGSGFVVNGKLFGITSWGIGCGRLRKAGVYTNVPLYRGWIRLYTGV